MTSVSGQVARVAREIESVKDLQEPVLNLNYCNLEEIPEQLLCSEYCKKKLQKLYLKRNCIKILVCCRKVLSRQILVLCVVKVLISVNQPHPLFLLLQNADLNKFQALTFLYLHSNNLTELPHGG